VRIPRCLESRLCLVELVGHTAVRPSLSATPPFAHATAPQVDLGSRREVELGVYVNPSFARVGVGHWALLRAGAL
jgi:hypothetical protein